MDIGELRTIVSSSKKFPGTKMLKSASVCNDGFPGNFNLSFTEAEMIDEYNNQYVDYTHNLIYSKIQPVIRHNDFINHIAKQDSDAYRYLSVFDLADVGGSISLVDGTRRDEIARFSIQALYNLLIESLRLDPKKLRISYFSGGNVRKATEGKYTFDFDIPSDPSIAFWKESGINEAQLIPDKTRSTFLALNIYGKHTPWGYRHEINYLVDDQLLDIGTFELGAYRPSFEGENITGLTPWKHTWSISAIGLERVLVAVNNFKRITECNHIQPLIDSILHVAKHKDRKSAEVLGQSLRAIHRIANDCGTYVNISRHRKMKLRNFYRALSAAHRDLGIKISRKQVENWLSLNADLQSFYPELRGEIGIVAQQTVDGTGRLENEM